MSVNNLERIQKVLKEIDTTDTKLNVAINNKLFDQNIPNEINHEKIHELLTESRIEADAGNIAKAESAASKARQTLYHALNKPSKFWRFRNLFGGFVWIYLFTFISMIFSFFYFQIDAELQSILNIPIEAIYATTWGIVGSILRSIWRLKSRVSNYMYRTDWQSYFIISPFLGGLFGAIIYLIIVAGLLGFSENEDINITNIAMIIPIATFAGFNWEWAIKKFSVIGEKL